MDLLPYQDIYANLMASALTTVAAHVGQASGPGQVGVMGDGVARNVSVHSMRGHATIDQGPSGGGHRTVAGFSAI